MQISAMGRHGRLPVSSTWMPVVDILNFIHEGQQRCGLWLLVYCSNLFFLFVVTKQPVVELRVIDDDDRLASVDWALKVKCIKAETAAEAASESVGCARCDSVIVACSDACRPADYDGMTIPPADRPTDRPQTDRLDLCNAVSVLTCISSGSA